MTAPPTIETRCPTLGEIEPKYWPVRSYWMEVLERLRYAAHQSYQTKSESANCK